MDSWSPVAPPRSVLKEELHRNVPGIFSQRKAEGRSPQARERRRTVAPSSLPSYTTGEHRDEIRGNGAREPLLPRLIGCWLVMSLFQHSKVVALEIPGG